jgi:hypothetical protein
LIRAIEDIASLARKMAETEPYKSANGAEALLAFAARLDEMATKNVERTKVVKVAVQKKRRV